MSLGDLEDSHQLTGRRRFRRLRGDPEVFALTQAVAAERHVSMTALLHPSRGSSAAAAARQLAMCLAHVLLQRPQDAVAQLFGRDRTTVAHACRAVEDQRDEPALEAEIARIEARLARREAARLELKHAA
jgi:chromosomal replication initiation ATPase DnaA